MGLISDRERLYEYRYVVDEMKIVNGSDVKTLEPRNVLNFTIEHNYRTNVFPFFKVTLALSPLEYDYVIKNSKNIKFKVRILKYSVNRATNSKSLKTEFINAMFTAYMDSMDSGLNLRQYKKRMEKEGLKDERDDISFSNNLMEVFLFNDNYVDKLRGTVNFVLASGTVGSCIGYILSKLGITNVLMSPLENNKSYSPFIMPSYDGITALSYLDQNYGLYRKGSMIYFGLKRGYILNCSSGCTAYEPGEMKKTNIIVTESYGGGPQYFGSIKVPNTQELEYRIAIPESCTDIQCTSEITNVLSGVDAKVVNAVNSGIVSASSGATTKGTKHNTTAIDSSENTFIASTYAAQQKRLSTLISIAADDSNPDAFEPNKEFSFIFENQSKNAKYKGSYLIDSCIMDFHGGPEFQASISATFSKV